VTAVLDIQTFVIGGSVWQHHGDWLQARVMQELESRLPALTAGVSLLPPQLDSYVADIGALHLVMPAEWEAVWRRTQPWQRLDSKGN
jgi:glucokinase